MIDLCSIRKIQTALKKFEETLKDETGLSLNDALCLCSIGKDFHEPGALSKQLELSPSRITRVLDTLEKRGFISRRISDTDRRNIWVELTDMGKNIIEEYQCTDIRVPQELAFTQSRQ